MAATRNRKSPDSLTGLRRLLRDRLIDWLGAEQLAGAAVAVGFSGGRDSLALLDALIEIAPSTGIRASAIHVHHGLSPNADRWAAFTKNFCKSRAVPLVLETVTVQRDSGAGLEAAARSARYEAFARLPVDLLLLGHHRDDQAETLLFNLLRGAGLQGAAAMPMLRPLLRTKARSAHQGSAPLMLGRPWLDVARTEIERYVAAADLDYIDDESNLDSAFSRNYLRLNVMPALAARFPQSITSLAAAAARFGEAAELLDALADLDLKAVAAGKLLNCQALTELDLARQKNLLRRWVGLQGGQVSSEASLIEFLRQCRSAAGDAVVAMHFGRLELRRWRDRIYALSELAEIPCHSLCWAGQTAVPWAGGEISFRALPTAAEGLRSAALLGRVEIRPRSGGESIRLRSGGPSRPLRLLFQERQLPPWERERLPYLWIDDQFAAVAGIGIDAAFRAIGDEPVTSFEWATA